MDCCLPWLGPARIQPHHGHAHSGVLYNPGTSPSLSSPKACKFQCALGCWDCSLPEMGAGLWTRPAGRPVWRAWVTPARSGPLNGPRPGLARTAACCRRRQQHAAAANAEGNGPLNGSHPGLAGTGACCRQRQQHAAAADAEETGPWYGLCPGLAGPGACCRQRWQHMTAADAEGNGPLYRLRPGLAGTAACCTRQQQHVAAANPEEGACQQPRCWPGATAPGQAATQLGSCQVRTWPWAWSWAQERLWMFPVPRTQPLSSMCLPVAP